jgi:hypothetical protein
MMSADALHNGSGRPRSSAKHICRPAGDFAMRRVIVCNGVEALV